MLLILLNCDIIIFLNNCKINFRILYRNRVDKSDSRSKEEAASEAERKRIGNLDGRLTID